MDVRGEIERLFRECCGNGIAGVERLQKSGSARDYYRITTSDGSSMIALFNPNREENDAFYHLTVHLASKDLPVPRISRYECQKGLFILEDGGEHNLYQWLMSREPAVRYNNETVALFKRALSLLIKFQTVAIEGAPLGYCYPVSDFGRRAIMWDMYYFKYMFLNLMGISFHEQRLEQDMEMLLNHLIEAPAGYLMYRDFQSANIMYNDDRLLFIDYQGARRGALQYDVASFIYDAKAEIPSTLRSELADYYSAALKAETGYDPELFKEYLSGFSLVRIMQALGAFGLRGLYEGKPTFTESIVPAVGLFCELVGSQGITSPMREMRELAGKILSAPLYVRLLEGKKESGWEAAPE